ncbi:MAG: metallophosphoesterase [Lachnospiraceae bacterium]|nr:metallophosphoesterase [Lachnospiraceae bacterium]
MMWVFLIAGSLILLALMGYSVLRGYHLWLRNRIPNAVYIVLQVILLGALFVCYCGFIPLPNEVLREVLQIISAIYLAVLLYTPVFCFFRGVIRFIGKRRKSRGRVYRFFNHPSKSIYIILGITACLGVFSVFRMRYVQVREYPMTMEKKMEEKEYSIAVLADLHLGTGVTRWSLDSLIEKTNEKKPDVIVLLGDIFDENTTEELKGYAAERMKQFSARHGVFYVDGNHEDNLSGDVTSYFTSAGITVLRNQTASLANGVQLVGVEEQKEEDRVDLSRLMKNLDREKPIVVLSHRPEQLPDMSAAGADAALCAHTHGGRYPFSWLFLPFFNDMIYGVKQYGAMSAITTSGAGGYGVPAKLTAPSEIVYVQISFS